MNKVVKIFILFIVTLGLLFPKVAFLQEIDDHGEILEAVVINVLEEKEFVKADGNVVIQQDLKLKIVNSDKEVVFHGISDLEVLDLNNYSKGDKVLVSIEPGLNGEENVYILDYVRNGKLYFLGLMFCVAIILVAGFKGFRAIISLMVSFFIIMKIIIPLILSGINPLFVGIAGALLILIFLIYLTEGINRKSNLAIFSVFLALLVVIFLSLLFSSILKLTGLAQEEIAYLVSFGLGNIDFKNLLLIAIVIGAVGVFDDLAVTQIESVNQIIKSNSNLKKSEVFFRAYEIGKSHIGSAVNTLFLAYVGASLPLLLLFSIARPPFNTFDQAINNEMIAIEIVRTLIGSIGLVMVMPIATYLAVIFLYHKKID